MSPFQVSFGLFVERVHFDIMPFFWFSSLDQSSHFVNSERIRENQNVRCWNRAIRIELLFQLVTTTNNMNTKKATELNN